MDYIRINNIALKPADKDCWNLDILNGEYSILTIARIFEDTLENTNRTMLPICWTTLNTKIIKHDNIYDNIDISKVNSEEDWQISYDCLTAQNQYDVNRILKTAFGISLKKDNELSDVNTIKLPEGTLSDEELKMIKEN